MNDERIPPEEQPDSDEVASSEDVQSSPSADVDAITTRPDEDLPAETHEVEEAEHDLSSHTEEPDAVVTAQEMPSSDSGLEAGTDDLPDRLAAVVTEPGPELDLGTFGEPLGESAVGDIDAALAALSQLSELAEDEDEEAEPEPDEQAEDATEQAALLSAEAGASPETIFPRPPLSFLQRGQSSSVIPALALIASGVGLTFALISGQILSLSLIMGLSLGVIGASLIGYWLSSRRWAQGSLVMGILLLIGAGWLAFGLEVLARDWYWLLVSIGGGLFLAGLIAPQHQRAMLLSGLLWLLLGGAGWLATGEVLPSDLRALIANLWPLAILILVILILVPARRISS